MSSSPSAWTSSFKAYANIIRPGRNAKMSSSSESSNRPSDAILLGMATLDVHDDRSGGLLGSTDAIAAQNEPFHQFRRFPTEIRLLIWEEMCRVPRWHTIWSYGSPESNRSHTPAPAITQVCQESRHVALKAYTLVRPVEGDRFSWICPFMIPMTSGNLGYFNLEVDVIYFPDGGLCELRGVLKDMLVARSLSYNVGQFQRLAFDMDYYLTSLAKTAANIRYYISCNYVEWYRDISYLCCAREIILVQNAGSSSGFPSRHRSRFAEFRNRSAWNIACGFSNQHKDSAIETRLIQAWLRILRYLLANHDVGYLGDSRPLRARRPIVPDRVAQGIASLGELETYAKDLESGHSKCISKTNGPLAPKDYSVVPEIIIVENYGASYADSSVDL